MKSIRALFFLLVVAALLTVGVPLLMAQTGSTGALTGTVTDPSGAVISGATVTATNVGTGQERTATTSATGAYKFALLPPGTYSVKFTASGFKTAEVPSIKVNVTETAVLNHSLEVGAQTQQVTVEATAVTIQTENATNGGLVSGAEVTGLPLVSRNYTQIVSLSPGVVANVTSASAVGNGTMDVAANGARQNQNNYSMDGSSVVNYLSGTGAQTGSFPGIAIPNPDTIQEFKVQTSQYDAASGRNSGANVDVVTKTGTNEFHGDVWEFNRNNFFNANDYFYKHTELNVLKDSNGNPLPNKPQTLKQNTFGFTLGGPIKKDKIFVFGSYQGLRQINGMGTSGFASGYAPNTLLMPWDDPNSPSDPRHLSGPASGPGSYRQYLGSVFGNGFNTGFFAFAGGTGVTIAPDGSNISNTAIAYLQAPGIVKGGYNNGFYFPSAPANCAWVTPNRPDSGCRVAISEPIRASENQYMINSSYILSSKHTLEERYMYQSDPQVQPFSCFWSAGNCNPGAPIDAHYFNHIGQLKLNSVLTGNFVNEVRFSFHRDVENNTNPLTLQACSISSTASIIPLVNDGLPCGSTLTSPNDQIAARFTEANLAPILDIWGFSGASGAWSQGGNFAMISSNFNNTFQWGDQISWTHGRQTIRAGFEAERLQHNGTIPASSRGELIFWSTPDFLTSSVGPLGNPYDPGYDDGTPTPQTGGIGIGFGLKGWLTHYNRVNAFTAYVQDDLKVSPTLTLNLGVRWEYNGFPNDTSGRFANTWKTELEKVNTGSWFLAHPEGTLVGFVVPSNYDQSPGLTSTSSFGVASGVVVNNNQTLVPGTPLHNFAPRLGLAWQPRGSKFVVRAGYGWFYDRVYGVLLIDNQLNLPPYSGAAAGPSPASFSNTLHDPFYAGSSAAPWNAGLPLLSWTPRYIRCAGPCGNSSSSGLGYTSDGPGLADRAPLTQQYSLDLQYEISPGWVADVGYVGSHGIHLYNWSQPINVAHLVPNAPNSPTHPQDVAMVSSSLPFNDPANTSPLTTNQAGQFGNANLRVSYLGFTPGGVGETNTTGDMLYNSLQAQLRHQFGHGLFLQLSYTWSKEFTNVDQSQAGSGITPPGAVLYGISNSNDPLNLRQQYGLATFNRPHRAVITYSYDLPYKRTEGVSGKVLGGWTLSGVTTIQNGEPFTITDSGGGSMYGAGTSR
ncbi:MAG TPA: carboxypeptidase-like regulatory domain-containing protein, partial [Candidatus Polarisedimenticolia bacterium]|nr:carboxypeptidase-like regulatory domain-containing protein [Candidatus Polarisedimenticolia bacterium]